MNINYSKSCVQLNVHSLATLT